jgi:hypothetical protein
MADDGYLRLTYTAFLRLRFRPHLVWPDDSLLAELAQESLDIRRAGYCEWVSSLERGRNSTNRLASIGWAWMETHEYRLLLVPGGVQSNLRLLSDDSRDLGTCSTQLLLSDWLDNLAWQESTHQSLVGTRQRHSTPAGRTWGSA